MTTDFHQAVSQILADADADIAARRPVCKSSGRCCHFETYNHRLYVTTAEAEHFAKIHAPHSPPQKIENQKSKIENPSTNPVSLPQFFSAPNPTGCPYQINNLCTAREARPLGCRVYFCDENAQSWQNGLYEKYHTRLQALHAQFAIPYRYLEWRQALREMLPIDREQPAGNPVPPQSLA